MSYPSTVDGPLPGGRRHARLDARAWIFATGAFAVIAMTIASFLTVRPLTAARADLRRVTSDGIRTQTDLGALRTSAVNWQIYIQSTAAVHTPGTPLSPADVAVGASLIESQTSAGKLVVADLHRIGRSGDATAIAADMAALNSALVDLARLANGSTIPAATRSAFLSADQTAFKNLWTTTTALSQTLSKEDTGVLVQGASDHLRTARTLFSWVTVFDVLLAVVIALGFGIRAGRRERTHRREARTRAFESKLQKALEMTVGETAVYDILSASLTESTPTMRVEMLVADSTRAHFRRAASSAGSFEGCAVVAPADCPAATSGQALSFATSGALDACPYLKERASGPCSAACIPSSIAGRTVGVMHAVGRDGVAPSEADVTMLQFTSRRATDRIAMLRAFAASEVQARTDLLTGLLNRQSLEHRVSDLNNAGIPYTLAYGGIDHFKALNDTYGHEAGDQALRLFARVLRDSVRPDDIAARSGEEEFLVVLPDCTTEVAVGLLERVRERLALALATGRVPSFTATFGVASTAYASDFEGVVAIADQALLDARTAGRNRVVVASR